MKESPLRTIEEENKIRAAAPVELYIMPIEPFWQRTGIESSFGGEIMVDIKRCGHFAEGFPVKCSKTGKKGVMYTDNTPREIIKEIIWREGK